MGKFIGGGRDLGSNRVKHPAECRTRAAALQVEGASSNAKTTPKSKRLAAPRKEWRTEEAKTWRQKDAEEWENLRSGAGD
jgi:hypothetical protein